MLLKMLEASSTLGTYESFNGIISATLMLGIAMYGIAILSYVATMMRFDRLEKAGLLGPEPVGFDETRETRREFHSRTRRGVVFGFIAGGCISVAISLTLSFIGIIQR